MLSLVLSCSWHLVYVIGNIQGEFFPSCNTSYLQVWIIVELTLGSRLELMEILCVTNEANSRRLICRFELCKNPTKCHAFARAFGDHTALLDAIDHATQKLGNEHIQNQRNSEFAADLHSKVRLEHGKCGCMG